MIPRSDSARPFADGDDSVKWAPSWHNRMYRYRERLGMDTTSGRFLLPALLLGVVLACTIVPHLWLGENTFILIHDHLDSSAAWAKVIAEGGYLFAHPLSSVEPIMGGQERWLFGKPFNIYYLLFAVFSPLTAIVANETLQRTIAFLGMFLLARRHLLRGTAGMTPAAAFAAAAYSALPFWPGGGIDVAATPLILSAFLDARARVHLFSAFVLAFLSGLFVNAFAMGIFIVTALGLVWLRDFVIEPRRSFGPAFGFLLLFCCVQFAGDYQMVYVALSGFVEATNRDEIVPQTFSFSQSLAASVRNFIAGQYHATPGQRNIILPLAVVILALSLGFARRLDGVAVLRNRLLLWMGAAAATALIYGFWRFLPVQAVWQSLGLPYINLTRFHWLQPMIWACVFTLSLGVIAILDTRKHVVWPMLLVVALSLGQTFNVLAMSDRRLEARLNNITFAEFVSAPLFDMIRAELDGRYDDYRVASIGLHPSIAQMNGFRTVDGYMALYPLHYKRQFRTIMAEELARNDQLRRYFDDWGSRAYIFSADTWARCGGLCTEAKAPESIELGFDAEAFLSLGGRFLFSVAEIENAREKKLSLRNVFSHDASPWRIHIYEIRIAN